jgi:hypothetical protein
MLFGALGRFALGQFEDAPSTAYLIATPGAYVITGRTAAFNTKITVTAGAYTINGSAAALATRMVASAGAYAVTGQAASFNTKLIPAAGVYAITGQSASFATRMPITAGGYAITGQSASFTTTWTNAAGSYALTGVAITFKIRMACAVGAYALIGSPAFYTQVINGAGGDGRRAGGDKKLYRGRLQIARRQILVTDDEGRTRRVDLLRHLKPPPPFAPAPDWVLPDVCDLPPPAEALPMAMPPALPAWRLPESLLALQDARDENELVELLTNSPDPLVEDIRRVLGVLAANACFSGIEPSSSPLVPAKAGTQGPNAKNWIPACAGMSGTWMSGQLDRLAENA